ncbi:MAG: hypothetical protein Q8K91_02860 [Hylemonella sp.]|nr:hypothetical protein [Hylemonella sp.]MDP1936130.1 hypothetical protein [Hylemonella sp.]
MALSFSTPLDIKRPYGSFRFDVFSLKADRRMTLYGKAALCQFIELESDFEVTALCERPLLIPDIKPKRLVDFWALNGGIPDLPGFSEPFIPVRRPGWGLNDIAV